MKLTLWHKVAITILLAALCSLLFGCSSQITYANGEPAGYEPTVGKLSDAYREANRKFFYGGLPEARTQIKFGELVNTRDRMAEIIERADGSWLITIDPKVHAVEAQAELSLYHEMCHQKNVINNEAAGVDGHEYMFQRCMEDIANEGGMARIW